MLQKIRNHLKFRATRRFYQKHERLFVPLMLLLGTIADFITFRTIEVSTAFTVLGCYTIAASILILYMHHYDASKILLETSNIRSRLRLIAPLIVQFVFGALLSASLVFYWFSGSFTHSWPLVILLLALMISNEVLRERYLRPIVQLSIFYFVLFATLAVALPVLFKSISIYIFIASGLASLLLMFVFIKILYQLRPDIRNLRPNILIPILSIFVMFNAAYFLNLIPPVPLSLTEIGVYESVERVGGDYILTRHDESLLDRLLPGKTIQAEPGERVYVFASIFAPVDLNTTITHDWQYLTDSGWKSINKLDYQIIGGRKDGYRGYSYITTFEPGRWRVYTKTPRGQVIGKISFKIE
jgi:hypothetical protein